MAGIETFDRATGRYEAWFLKHRNAYQAELRAVRELTAVAGSAIEIGVGSGRFAAPLGIPLGLDPSPGMLAIARTRGIETILGVAEDLPFSGSSFDLVLMVTTVCFLDDVQQAFREARRILRRGGNIVLGFVDRASPLGQSYFAHHNESLFYRSARFYTVEEVLRYLADTGFDEPRFRQTLFAPLIDTRRQEPVSEGHGEGSFVVVRATRY